MSSVSSDLFWLFEMSQVKPKGEGSKRGLQPQGAQEDSVVRGPFQPPKNDRSNIILKMFILTIEVSKDHSQYGYYERGLEFSVQTSLF